MAVFKAFKPEAMNKIAKAMGYTGDMGQFQSYIEQDPMRQQQMQRYTNAAMQMARGGVVKMQTGGTIQSEAVKRLYSPALPTGAKTEVAYTPSEAGQYVQPGTGTVIGDVSVPTAKAEIAQAEAPQQDQAAQISTG